MIANYTVELIDNYQGIIAACLRDFLMLFIGEA
jgi:hypothetical protein